MRGKSTGRSRSALEGDFASRGKSRAELSKGSSRRKASASHGRSQSALEEELSSKRESEDNQKSEGKPLRVIHQSKKTDTILYGEVGQHDAARSRKISNPEEEKILTIIANSRQPIISPFEVAEKELYPDANSQTGDGRNVPSFDLFRTYNLLDNMSRKGYLKKSNPENGSSGLFELTDKGRELLS